MPHKYQPKPIIFNIPEDEFAANTDAPMQLAALKIELSEKKRAI